MAFTTLGLSRTVLAKTALSESSRAAAPCIRSTARRMPFLQSRPLSTSLPSRISSCRHSRFTSLPSSPAHSIVPSRLYTSSKSSTPGPQYSISDVSEDEYHTISDSTMDRMVEYFEDLGDEHEIPGYDVEYQSGVMTLKLGAKGTYVVNKQPPNKQLWLSSPTSGPKRYDYDTEHHVWFYNRDHHSLKYLLDTEITKALGLEIDIPMDGPPDA
ncbi:Mitochondrial chaperone Frataxin [Lunasporangiospora selenospora]|uniref:ferroxidase n=1 Tax=Lunasporangiospora selenospora TaxID=979761 RepID=A0A9P6KFK3_9FUNG|nr:Mitochondrial chaperone Frataxin [Lunasporangiospora selenospora]